jgi:beta-galactosidase
MLSVEVHDSAERVIPMADNEIAFAVTGPGTLIGVGNGDPTSHESDIGSSRKAFSGLAAAMVQSTRKVGQITVTATSPGLQSSVRVSSAPAKLRPQVAVWERAVPEGSGITGLWRPVSSDQGRDMLAMIFGGGKDSVFTLIQNGSSISGKVEEPGGMFVAGGSVIIDDGRIDGSKVSFRAGTTTYSGNRER